MDEKKNRLTLESQGKFLMVFYSLDFESVSFLISIHNNLKNLSIQKVNAKTKNNFQLYPRNMKEILPIDPFNQEYASFKKG